MGQNTKCLGRKFVQGVLLQIFLVGELLDEFSGEICGDTVKICVDFFEKTVKQLRTSKTQTNIHTELFF